MLLKSPSHLQTLDFTMPWANLNFEGYVYTCGYHKIWTILCATYKNPFSNAYCDVCYSTIIGPRTICLLCTSEDDQVDLCNSCIKEPVRRREFTHSPLHDMVQVRQVVHRRDRLSLIASAREAVNQVKFGIGGSNQLESLDASIGPKWRCSRCDHAIHIPCWFCIICGTRGYYPEYQWSCWLVIVTETFICDSCKVTNASCRNDDRADAHPLVLVNKSVEDRHDTIGDRLLSLETRCREDWATTSERLGHLEQKFQEHKTVMNDRLTALELKVEGRLTTVEGLLKSLVERRFEK